MTQCSFIGSVAFALRCARRSRFTTLSRIFPPSLSAVVPSLLFTRFPFSSIVLFIFTLVSSFPSTLVSSFHPRSCPCNVLRWTVCLENRLFSFNSKKYRLSLFLLFLCSFENFVRTWKDTRFLFFELSSIYIEFFNIYTKYFDFFR